MSPNTVLICIQYDFIHMYEKNAEIQNDLYKITQVKLTSYLFNKIAANRTMFIVHVLTTL